MTILETYQAHLKDNYIFYTIDPGARPQGGTGLARWNTRSYTDITRSYTDIPHETEQFTSTFKTHEQKVEHILHQVKLYFQHLNKEKFGIPRTHGVVFIEEPQYFDSFKGQTAASSNSLFKLIYFYGRLYQLIFSLKYKVVPLRIVDWKGQLTKQQVSMRVQKICGNFYGGDICDAVGMGLYILGKF